MDHEYAIEHHAVEQYLLGEMNEQDGQAFEEHYFSCPECAEAVRTGVYFADNARFAVKEKSGKPDSPRNEALPPARGPGTVSEMKTRPDPGLWHRIAPPVGAAAAVAIAFLGYQSLTGTAHEKPRILARTMLAPAARGEETAIIRSPVQKFIVLKLDVNSDEPFAHYRVDIEAEGGKSIMRDTGDKGADGALEIEVPSAELPPGHYVLLVHGQNDSSGSSASSGAGGIGPEITRSKFLVKD